MSAFRWSSKQEAVPALRLMWEFTTPEERREMSASQELRTLLRVAFVAHKCTLKELSDRAGRNRLHVEAFQGMLRGNFYVGPHPSAAPAGPPAPQDEDIDHFRSYERVGKANRLYSSDCVGEAFAFLGVDTDTHARALELYKRLPTQRPLSRREADPWHLLTQEKAPWVSFPRQRQETPPVSPVPLPEPSLMLRQDQVKVISHLRPEQVWTPAELLQAAKQLYASYSGDKRWVEMSKRSYVTTPDGKRQVDGCSPSTLNGVVKPGKKTRKVPTEKTFSAFLRACEISPKKAEGWLAARKRAEAALTDQGVIRVPKPEGAAQAS